MDVLSKLEPSIGRATALMSSPSVVPFLEHKLSQLLLIRAVEKNRNCVLGLGLGPNSTDHLAAYNELLHSLVPPLPETAMPYILHHGCLTISTLRSTTVSYTHLTLPTIYSV